jgi:hypothetical protein
MAEATSTTLRRAKLLDRLPLNLLVAGNNHLRNALARLDGEGLVAKVHEDNLNLATIVGIDSAR